MLERRANSQHFGIGLGVDQAREAVAGRTADARARRQVCLVEHDSARRVERPVARGSEVIRELLDARLVRHGRMRVGRARRWLGRILPTAPWTT